MSNQVTLTFAGDSSKLEKAFESVGQSARKMDTEIGKASKSAGEGFDRAGEAADTFDTRSMGARDGITGIQDTMTGFSSLAQGDYVNGLLNLGSGFSDIGSSLYNFVIPSLKSLSKEAIVNAVNIGRNTAATVASKVAQVAIAGATKAWAAAQWLINAALTANPIGLVIAAVALLVVGIIYAYKHSDKFRAVVQAAFKAVLAVAQAVGKWFKDTLWPWLRDVFNKVGGAAGAVKNGVVSAFNGIVGWLKSFPGKVKGYFDSAVQGGAVLLNWAKAVPGKIAGFFKGIGNAILSPFKAGFDGIRNAWNNTIGGKGFTVPGWIPKVGGKSFTIPYFHTGGIVPGGLGSESLAVLRAGERVTSGANSPDTQPAGPIYLEAHIDLGNDVTKVVQVQFREQNRALKRAVMAGAR